MKEKLEDQQEIKLRTQQYRQLQKDFIKKKEFVIGGNRLENFKATTTIPYKVQMNEEENMPDSLKQLAELEKRIFALESTMADNTHAHPSSIGYDRLQKFQSRHKPLKSIEKSNKSSQQYPTLKKLGPQTESIRFKPKFGHHYLDKIKKSNESRNQKRGIFLTQTDNEYDDGIDNEDIFNKYVLFSYSLMVYTKSTVYHVIHFYEGH